MLLDVQATRKKQQKMPQPLKDLDRQSNLYVDNALPVHAQLFEKHRLKSIKRILSTLLHSELRYHCKVIEELSEVLQSLSDVDDDVLLDASLVKTPI
jgi:hypothetical protein